MKYVWLLVSLFLLVACGNEAKYENQPKGPWTYPVTGYRAVQKLAARSEDKEIARLVGWDEGYYYFDWSQAEAAIVRGAGRVNRKQFDVENGGALTLEKGRLTVQNGQVRTLILQ